MLNTKLFFVLLLLTTVVKAQESITIGHKLTISSEVLSEDREVLISLPKSYNDTVYTQKSYPVCYFFDGDSHFENLVAQTNRLSKGLYKAMPEIILVGIIQKDRANELTPTKMKNSKNNLSSSGGNEAFMNFIENELKPHINKTYRTNNYNILIGHSFGGLAVINTFLKHPTYFNAYIAIDPSMWWDHQKLLNSVDSILKPKIHKNSALFVAKADDAGSGKDHHEAILQLNNKLDEFFDTNNTYKYAFYKGENHGSVVVPAEYDAIRFIFDGYELPVKKAMKKPELIDNHYKNVSKKLGYKILPDEKLIDELAKVCQIRGFLQQAKYLLKKNTVYYPKSTRAKEQYKAFLTKEKT